MPKIRRIGDVDVADLHKVLHSLYHGGENLFARNRELTDPRFEVLPRRREDDRPIETLIRLIVGSNRFLDTRGRGRSVVAAVVTAGVLDTGSVNSVVVTVAAVGGARLMLRSSPGPCSLRA